MDESCFKITQLPTDSRKATKYVVEKLLRDIYPLLHRICNKLQLHQQEIILDDGVFCKIREVYALCTSQIKKCVLILLNVFKQEYHLQLYLQESRHCVLERLLCCFEKLYSIDKYLEESHNMEIVDLDNSMFVTCMYFVNWIDQTFEILNKMSLVVYKTDCHESGEIYEEWKNDVIECVSGLHTSIDELLLSAMTLCRYCLPLDQPIVKVRCQVVLRETKALLSDLIEGDLDTVCHATKESLKLPIMPSNTNLLIDVLKDVLYVLETNTNTALLALLVHCFSYSSSPAEILRDHLSSKSNNKCPCNVSYDDVTECCLFVKEFDLYNERLLQIGSFAISCSSDQKRVLSLKSGLASLEALDPHLVPALMLSPHSTHSNLILDTWNKEVLEIKSNVFLIVDPTAFSEKAKQMMHQTLLEITKDNRYNNSKVCSVINIGCTIYDFFTTYSKYEPEALEKHTELLPLLDDLNKVQLECKVVNNMLSSGDDYVFDMKKSKPIKDVSFGQLLKRLKLLFTIVTRVHTLVSPKENDQHFYEDDPAVDNLTRTLYGKNFNTYVNSPRKPMNTISRSIFTRTANIRSSTAKFPLAILTKNLRAKKLNELSFSVKLDEICDLMTNKLKHNSSILYNSSMKNRSSLRKAVLNRQCMAGYKEEQISKNKKFYCESSVNSDKGSLMDDTTSLQITEVLNQINDLTNISTSIRNDINSTIPITKQKFNEDTNIPRNILRLNINTENTAQFKHIWNISVNSGDSKLGGDNSHALNGTQASNITTLERISDLEFVENKLNELKTIQKETSL